MKTPLRAATSSFFKRDGTSDATNGCGAKLRKTVGGEQNGLKSVGDENFAEYDDGGISNAGTLTATNATVAGNVAPVFDDGKLANADELDLRLALGAPAINAGNNGRVPDELATDLSGNARILDGTVDLGAYEYLPSISGSIEFLCQSASSVPGATFEAALETARTWLDEWSNFLSTFGRRRATARSFRRRTLRFDSIRNISSFPASKRRTVSTFRRPSPTASSGARASGKTLLARVRFEPISQEIAGESRVGGVAIPQDGVLKSVAPGFSADLAAQNVNGNAAAPTDVALYPVDWDFNDDGKITALDFNPFAKYFGFETSAIPASDAAYRIFDVNGDGKLTALDFNDFVGRVGVQATRTADSFYSCEPNVFASNAAAESRALFDAKESSPIASLSDVEVQATALASLADEWNDGFRFVFDDEDDEDDAFWKF